MAQVPEATDPQASVPGAEEGIDASDLETLPIRRRPTNESNSIEAQQSVCGSDPEEAVASLGNPVRLRAEVTVADPPGCVAILGDSPV